MLDAHRSTSEPDVALLVRHRWLGNGVEQTYVCTPGIQSLYRSYDPICYGCSSRIPWSSLRGLDRFRGVSDPRNRLMGENLGVRLDLKICELAVAERFATTGSNWARTA